MNAYQPTSRRPIADVFRRTAHAAVRICVRLGVHPDVISYLSIVAAAGAGAIYWQGAGRGWLLACAPLLCFLRLWFNMLDGMVALASGKASLKGEIVNELPDRISDVLIFAGVAHSGLASPFLGYWAAILALLTAYIGTLGQALGGKRRFEGVMSKQWRMVALAIGTWAAIFIGEIGRLRTLDWTCIVIIAGCVQTCWARLRGILRDLRERANREGNLK